MTNVLTLKSVSFRYRGAVSDAVSDLNASFGIGVTGLLGPNGAGKTSLIKVLAGIEKPTSGELIVAERKVVTAKERSELREQVGYLPQQTAWFGHYSVSEFVEYFALLRSGRRKNISADVEKALRRVNLWDLGSRKLKSLSGGQRQRAFIAQAIVHNPGVLILDEPTAALDPLQRIEIKNLLVELGSIMCVIVSTHLVDDLISSAHQILVLDNGRELWAGSPDELQEHGLEASNQSKSGSAAELGLLRILGSRASTSESLDDQ